MARITWGCCGTLQGPWTSQPPCRPWDQVGKDHSRWPSSTLGFEQHRYTHSSPAAQAERTPRPPPGHLKPPTCRTVTCSPCPFVTLLILLPELSIRFTLNSKERGGAATLPAGICRPVFLRVSTHSPSLLRPVFFFRSPLPRSHPFIRLWPCQPPPLDGGGGPQATKGNDEQVGSCSPPPALPTDFRSNSINAGFLMTKR